MGYATTDDVFQLGLSAAAFVVRGRPFDAVDATTATVRLKGHGLSSSDIITFEVTSGGALPTGITGFAPYYPVPRTHDLFQVSTTPAGSAIASWLSAGAGWVIVVDPTRRLQKHIDDTAAVIDEHLTAHEPPILPDPTTGLYPPVLVGLNARMAARAAVVSLQFENSQYRAAVDRLNEREKQDLQLLADWKAGKPIQPRPTDEDSIADNSARAAYGYAASAWTRSYL